MTVSNRSAGLLCLAAVAGLAALSSQSGPARAEFEAATAWRAANVQRVQSAALEGSSGLQAVHLSSQLQGLSQSMITHSLLAALKIDKEANIQRLVEERKRFVATLNALRTGDGKLGLQATTNPEILARLGRLEKEWSIFGPAVQSIIETKQVTPQNVAIVAECIEPLAEATYDLMDVYEYYATGGQAFSMLTDMVSRAETQHSMLSEMIAGYLLIAYGHKTEDYRVRLWAYQAQFDQTFKVLIDGDRKLGLLPAPRMDLRQQFQASQEIWRRICPILQAVANGRSVNRLSIGRVTKESQRLASGIGKAVEIFRQL